MQLLCKKKLEIFPSPDFSAGDGKIDNLFYSVDNALCMAICHSSLLLNVCDFNVPEIVIFEPKGWGGGGAGWTSFTVFILSGSEASSKLYRRGGFSDLGFWTL
jgi:hypothetical protein